jgi:hypothetical protein
MRWLAWSSETAVDVAELDAAAETGTTVRAASATPDSQKELTFIETPLDFARIRGAAREFDERSHPRAPPPNFGASDIDWLGAGSIGYALGAMRRKAKGVRRRTSGPSPAAGASTNAHDIDLALPCR